MAETADAVDTPPEMTRNPGDDEPVTEDDLSQTVIKSVKAFRDEAADARRTRMKQNRINRDAYLGRQDWSHKLKGQSQEFLPKTPVAVEQFSSFIKRALTQFGAWYDPMIGRNSKSPLSAGQIRALMDTFFEDLRTEDRTTTDLATLIGDGIKIGALESLCVFKVFGQMENERVFSVEPGEPFIGGDDRLEMGEDQLVATTRKVWRLRVDLVRPEDYYPDPTGRGLYEIHETERDLHYVIRRAEEGIYDPVAVEAVKRDLIAEDQKKAESESRTDHDRNQDRARPPAFRKRVKITEFWGTLLDHEGNVVHENVLVTVANDKHLIRRPESNPFWHQESPFEAIPVIRVPFSVWHKALYDNAVMLNLAQNELFNLILDGGLASVWGIKQLRIDDLEDPRQVQDGIPQGETLVVKGTLPVGAKVLEQVTEGEVPTDAMAILEMLNREFAAAALSNELKMGSLPPKQVKATEVVELTQSQAITLDAIVGDIEKSLMRLLRKAWLTILQNITDVAADRIIGAIGVRGAFALAKMSPAERFSTFNNVAEFKVHGLSSLMARVRDFQKTAALLQLVMTNPLLLQAFVKRYSGDRILAHVIKMLSINPEAWKRDEEELQRTDQDVAEMMGLAQNLGLTQGGQGGAGMAAEDAGEPGLPAEINQAGNPLSGLGGGG